MVRNWLEKIQRYVNSPPDYYSVTASTLQTQNEFPLRGSDRQYRQPGAALH